MIKKKEMETYNISRDWNKGNKYTLSYIKFTDECVKRSLNNVIKNLINILGGLKNGKSLDYRHYRSRRFISGRIFAF